MTWSSSATTVATINSAGLATAIGVGSTTITATSGSINGTAQLTVTTNTGGSSCRLAGILVLTVNGSTIDAAYQPYSGVNGSSVQVVNLDSTSSSSALITSIAMPANYTANATAANQSLLKVVVISYTSSVVQVIDATTNTIIHTFDSGVTGSAGFSGGSCTICGALIDPVNNLAVLDTAQGYYTMDLGSGAFTPLTTAFAAENFSLDSTAQLILSPTYDQDPNNGSEAQILHISGNTISTNTKLGITEPDSAATDLSTGVGVVVDEQGGNQTLINMSQVTVSSGNWSAPTALYAIPGCQGSEMTMIAADSTAHILFSSEEFGTCTAVEGADQLGAFRRSSDSNNLCLGTWAAQHARRQLLGERRRSSRRRGIHQRSQRQALRIPGERRARTGLRESIWKVFWELLRVRTASI